VPLAAGARIGSYEITDAIGAGGMGEVYRARDSKLDRDVALKILPESIASDPDRVMRFEREAKTLATLNHPHIAQIYGMEAAASAAPAVLVMELVDGEDLAQRITRGPIPLDETLPIARQIAQALEAAHASGVVHRDLKPANIMVRDDGTVKVLDFGLAKIGAAGATSGVGGFGATGAVTSPAMTQAGLVLGTAAYMAPEQAKGRAVDKRADVWAFGCVMYEMLSGKRAFDGDDVSETLASVLKDEPDWSALPQTANSAVRVLLRRCLQRDPARRIGDASALLFVLDEIDSLAESNRADVSDVSRQIAEAVAANRRGLLRRFVPAIAVLLVAVAALVTVVVRRPSPAPPLITRFSIAIPPEQRALTAINRGVLAISNDGSQLAWTGTSGIFTRSVADMTAQRIVGADAGAGNTQPHTLVFSPDARALAFIVGSQLKRIALSGGTPVDVCTVAPSFGITWSDRGIFIGQGPEGVRRCSPEGGVPEQLLTVAEGEEAHGAQLLPGGDAVLTSVAKTSDGMTRWDKARIIVHSLRTGERRTILNGGSDARYLPSGHLLYAVGGIVFAVPFDVSTLTVVGGPVAVIEGIRRPVGAVTAIAHYATSATGSLLYVPGEVRPSYEYSLAVADRASNIAPLPLGVASFRHVRASRDGKRLAIGTDNGKEAIVSLYDIGANTVLQRLTLEGNNRFPIWSPDGQRLAFQSDRGGDLAIYVQQVDGSAPAERVTNAGQGEAHVPNSWSPDGATLAYSVEKDSTYSLWLHAFASKTSKPLGSVRSLEPLGAAFSPDGRWLMYTQTPERGGQRVADRGVFIQPFPPTGTAYQVPQQGLDFHPVWSASGGEIIFVVSAASGRMAAVPMSVQPRVSFGPPVSFPAIVTADRTSGLERAWDVLPDGRFIGLVNPAQQDGPMRQTELRMVLHWFEEVKQRALPKN
jgi:serine/threonine-protein kinase